MPAAIMDAKCLPHTAGRRKTPVIRREQVTDTFDMAILRHQRIFQVVWKHWSLIILGKESKEKMLEGDKLFVKGLVGDKLCLETDCRVQVWWLSARDLIVRWVQFESCLWQLLFVWLWWNWENPLSIWSWWRREEISLSDLSIWYLACNGHSISISLDRIVCNYCYFIV